VRYGSTPCPMVGRPQRVACQHSANRLWSAVTGGGRRRSLKRSKGTLQRLSALIRPPPQGGGTGSNPLRVFARSQKSRPSRMSVTAALRDPCQLPSAAHFGAEASKIVDKG
jgi:hypothetical protein